MLAAVLIALAIASPSQATIQPWQITGTVSEINASNMQSVTAPFVVGDVFVHEFTIDDSVSASGGGGNYANYPAIVFSEIQIPSRGFSLGWSSADMVTTNNFAGDGVDTWELSGFAPDLTTTHPSVGTDIEGLVTLSTMWLRLDVPPAVFGSTNPPPMVQPDPVWPVNGYAIHWEGDDGSYYLNLSVSSFTAIPEPTALSLVGLGGLLAIRRRHRFR
jgi:hypothetical protein